MDTVRYFKDLAKAQLRQSRLDGAATLGLQKMQHQVAVNAGFRSWDDLLAAPESERELVVLMDREPSLNMFGFGPGDFARTREERMKNMVEWRRELRAGGRVQEIRTWIVDNLDSRKTINQWAGSYGLKHLAEQDLGYVANGEFIAAAILEGYPYRRDSSGPNATFGMSERSISAIRKRQRG
ncbi:hypothetical protein [Leifsonia sp. P73]|uniref:hypothetical protein n=1 Tax=Leifsonia sp. P73 TaxID=3423959 RepID=UPI003DA52A53